MNYAGSHTSNQIQAMVQAFCHPEGWRGYWGRSPVPGEDSDEAIGRVTSVTHQQALATPETLALYRLESGLLNDTTEERFYHEPRCIEPKQGKQIQITTSSSCTYVLLY